jgi:nucleoid DNA-binding protein
MNSKVVEHIRNSTDLSEGTVELVLESFINCIQVNLRRRENVAISGFGTFSSRFLDERKGRNPKTGEAIDIPAKYKPSFKFSPLFDINPGKEQVSSKDSSSIPPIPQELLSSGNLWHIQIQGQPTEVPESELLANGVTMTTPVWSKRTGWKQAKDIPELSYLF